MNEPRISINKHQNRTNIFFKKGGDLVCYSVYFEAWSMLQKEHFIYQQYSELIREWKYTMEAMLFLYRCLSNEFPVFLFEIVPVRSISPVTAVR